MPGSVRPEWLYDNARSCQEILCEARSAPLTTHRLVAAFLRLPEAVTALEHLVQRGLIVNVVLGCVEDPSESRPERLRCYVQRLLTNASPRQMLLESAAQRAATLILQNCSQPLNASQIAKGVGCGPSSLRRAFKSELGMQMRQFHTMARVFEAVKIFAAGRPKISAVARLVGYRSDKDLYRALRHVTGLRPSELRTMTPEALRALAAQIRLRLDKRSLIWLPNVHRTPWHPRTIGTPRTIRHPAISPRRLYWRDASRPEDRP
jgi:AraC-like DNA-binding protein